MKKIVSTATLGILLFLGSVVVHAQGLTVSDKRPENIAKEKISMIQKEIELSGDQQRALFRAYVKREVGIKKHIADKDPKSPAVQQQKSILNNELEKAVEKELTVEQFAQWKQKFAEKEIK